MKKAFVLFLLINSPNVIAEAVLGWVEVVELDKRVILHAKLDSGAKTSSLHIDRSRFYRIDTVPWIHFSFHYKGKEYEFKKKVVRLSKIKNRFNISDLRPVVEMDIRICDRSYKVEINLSNRSGYQYPLLVGRNFLAGKYLIDTEKIYLADRLCPNSGPAETL